MDGNLIIETLERVAELHGDPADLVYAELFKVHPAYEELFLMDEGGGVRGTMLATSLDCVVGLAEGSNIPLLLMEAAQLQHDAYGLKGEELAAMFVAMRDAFRIVLAAEWSGHHETAWQAALQKLEEISRTAAE
ncbi:MAG: globin [Henriciella sp.]